MNIEKFTQKGQELVQQIVGNAMSAGNPEITNWHLLAGLLNQQDSMLSQIFKKNNVDTRALNKIVQDKVSQQPTVSGQNVQKPGLSANLFKVLDQAQKDSESNGDQYVSVDQILVSLLDNDLDARELFTSKTNISIEQIKEQIETYRGNKKVDNQNPENTLVF